MYDTYRYLYFTHLCVPVYIYNTKKMLRVVTYGKEDLKVWDETKNIFCVYF